ncbi:uncharacterized protein FOMMEDRAFT_154586 [Fomitiporia mediterranea MF3/22]|uniref:uncharacterized protein n=1 Tax=Fomitiporia mediterranea (strain MF3/22) TaxID=694068 RepID=UPI000440794E|nr:uncharacterized protein FOMMEDRAFT_154586 [Fomitiporia mediterranea MF3/22]EJD03509.1 hypothetical protein FOMMEDRAFT_154586 [Fomitiporia mediterranea MF3/22]
MHERKDDEPHDELLVRDAQSEQSHLQIQPLESVDLRRFPVTSHRVGLSTRLEEIQIIRCSLLPSELFAFVLPHDDLEEWSGLLRNYEELGRIDMPVEDWQPASTCRFTIRVKDMPFWLEVELPRKYPSANNACDPIIHFRANNLDRQEQEKWQQIVGIRLTEIKLQTMEFVVQNLLCSHLIPLLHEHTQALRSSEPSSSEPTSQSPEASYDEIYHVLFTSHHLISPAKRRNLQKWSAELSLRGFAKVGYPGVIYAEGAQDNVTEFVSRVKAMQWLALKVRFEEALDTEKHGQLLLSDDDKQKRVEREDKETRSKTNWTEVEKVGEVVEIMRRSSREEFVTEMGLGSVSSSSNNNAFRS